MTCIANLWESFVLALLKPFIKAKQDAMKLAHTIEMDRVASQQRHVETILDSQKELAHQMREMNESNTAVIREWLEGFHKIPTQPIKSSPVNNDERMWRLEMEELARQAGKQLTQDMSPYEIEAIIKDGFGSL